MSKVFTGTTTNNVTELTLQEEGVGNIGTQTIVWDGTQGTIDQVIGDIPNNWKDGDDSLKQLQIGSSCTSIGSHAFYYCSGFTGALTIPNSVTSIKFQAFENCSGLTGSLTIPDSVTFIGYAAFQGCSGLNGSLTLPTNPNFTSIRNSAFRECTGLTGSLVIPDSVTTIEDFSFRNCGFTGSLTIPDSVISIGYAAFQGCINLTGSITIGNNVTNISGQAFGYCIGVNTLYTNADVASWIGIDGLTGTSSLTTIYVGPDAVGTYTSTFQQGSGMTVLPWNNYPNPIPN